MRQVKAIIAGSRSIRSFDLVHAACVEAVTQWQCVIVEVISGRAPGVDVLGEQFAALYKIPVKDFPAKWDDLTAPGAVIRESRRGPYNVMAGFSRNEEMAQYGDVLICVWDGISTGSVDMMKRMQRLVKPVYVKNCQNLT